jgi:hypothetical protein
VFADKELGEKDGLELTKRHYLVLVNPQSGPGKSLKVFHRILEPKLKAAGITHELVITGSSHFSFIRFIICYKRSVIPWYPMTVT